MVTTAAACARLDLLAKMLSARFSLPLSTSPKMPGTMDQEDSYVRDDAQRKRGVSMVNADSDSGMYKAESASNDAIDAVLPSIVCGYNMPGIMVGMDQQDSNSSDEVQFKRCKVSVMDDDWLSDELQIDPIIDEV